MSTADSVERLMLTFVPTGNTTEITWEAPSIGTHHSIFESPYAGSDLELVIKALDAVQYPEHPVSGPTFGPDEQTRLNELGLWGYKRVAPKVSEIVGHQLFTALTDDQNGHAALRQVRETARYTNRPIHYVLRFPQDAVELAALPWEALHDQQQAVLLSRGAREIDSCERYLILEMAVPPRAPTNNKVRILALSPTADMHPKYRQQEREARLQVWEHLSKEGLIEWDELAPVTIANLDDWMRRNNPPDILHFYGHGLYQQGQRQGQLLFDAPDTAHPEDGEWVSAQRLASLLGDIRLILLCACQSSMVGTTTQPGGLLTGIAPTLSVVSEVVVAMQLTTRMEAATRFSTVFYEEVTKGRSVQAAVAEARRSLYVTEAAGVSWYVPTLYIRGQEAKPKYLVSHPPSFVKGNLPNPHPSVQIGDLHLLLWREERQFALVLELKTDHELTNITITFHISTTLKIIPAHFLIEHLRAYQRSEVQHLTIEQSDTDRSQQRRERLEKRIQETLSLIDELEDQRRLALLPNEQRRMELERDKQHAFLEEYEQELRTLTPSQSPTLSLEVSYRTGGILVQKQGHITIPTM